MSCSIDYLWYPFLQYQDDCAESNSEASITSWLLHTGKLNHYKLDEEVKQNIVEETKLDAVSKEKLTTEEDISRSSSVEVDPNITV